MTGKGLTKWLDKAKKALGIKKQLNGVISDGCVRNSGSHATNVPGKRMDSNFLEDEDEYPAQDLSDLTLLRSGPSKRKGVSFSTGPPQDLLSGTPRIPSILAARSAAIQHHQAFQLDGSAVPRGPARPMNGSPRASPLLSSPRGSNLGQIAHRSKQVSDSDALGQRASQDGVLWVTEPFLDGCQEIRQLAGNCAVTDVSFPGDLPTVTPQSLQSALASSGMAVVVARLNMLDLSQDPPVSEHQADEDAMTIKRHLSRSRSKLQRSHTLNSLKRTQTSNLNQTAVVGDQLASPSARPARARRASLVTLLNNSPVAEEASQLKLHKSVLHHGPSRSVGEEEPHTAQLFAMLAKTTRHLRAAAREPNTTHSRRLASCTSGPADEAGPGHEELYDTDVGDDLKLLQELLKVHADPGTAAPDQGSNADLRQFNRRIAMVEQASRSTSRLPDTSFDGLKDNEFGLWLEEPWYASQQLAHPKGCTPRPLDSLGAHTHAGNACASEGKAIGTTYSSPNLQGLLAEGCIWSSPAAQLEDGPRDSVNDTRGSKALTPLSLWSGQQPARTSISSATSHMLHRALSHATSKPLSGHSRSPSRNLSRNLSHAWSKAPSALLASMTSSQMPGTTLPAGTGWTGYCNFEQDQRYSASAGAFSQTTHSQWFGAHSSPGEAASNDSFLPEGLMMAGHTELGSTGHQEPEAHTRRSKSCAGNFSRSQTEVLSECLGFMEAPASPTRVDDNNATHVIHRENQTTLWPVFYNAAAAALLRLASVQACSAILTSHICNNPSLMLVLEELFEEGLCGRCHTYTHYLPAQALQLSSAATQAGAHQPDEAAMPASRRSFTNELPRMGSTNGGASGWLQIQLMVVNLATSEHQHDPGLFILYRPASLAVPNHLSVNVLSTMPSVLESVHESAPPRPTGKASGTFSLADELAGPPRRWSMSKGPSSFLDDARSSRPSRTRCAMPLRQGDAAVATKLTAHMQLVCMALAHVPCIITILTLDGRILFQNGRSVEYSGLVANKPTQISRPLGHPGHPLSRLYKLDMPSLMSMVAAIQAGQYWSGLVRVLPRADLSSDYCPDPAHTLATLEPVAKQTASECSSQASEPTGCTDSTTAGLPALQAQEKQGKPDAAHSNPLIALQSALYQSSSESGTAQGSSIKSPSRSLEHIMSQAYASLDEPLAYPTAKQQRIKESFSHSTEPSPAKDEHISFLFDNGAADLPGTKTQPEWFGSASGSVAKDEHSSSGAQDLGGDRLLGKRASVEDLVPDLPAHFGRAPALTACASPRVPSGRCSMDSALRSYASPLTSQVQCQPDNSDAAGIITTGSMRFERRLAGNGQRGSLDQSSAASSLWAKKIMGATSVSSSGGDQRQSLDEMGRSDTADLSESRSGLLGRSSQLVRSVSIVKRERRSHMSGALLSAEQEFSGTARAMKAFNARAHGPASTSGSEASEVSSLRRAELSANSVYPESQGSESRQQSKDLEGAVSVDSGRMEPCVRSRSRFALSAGPDVGVSAGASLEESTDGTSGAAVSAATQEPVQKLSAATAAPAEIRGVTVEAPSEQPQDEEPSSEAFDPSPAAADACCWHVIEAHCLPGDSPDQQLLVLVQSDVTHYVNAELELKKVLDVEHKLLEEIFPRHVLEAMAAQMTSPAKIPSGRLSPHGAPISPLADAGLDMPDTSGKLFRLSQSADFVQPDEGPISPPNQLPSWALQMLPQHSTAEGSVVTGGSPTPSKLGKPAAKISATGGLPSALARHHPAVTVLFADIKNFTNMCNSIHPQTVMSFLNQLFSEFDALVEQHGIYKVETIGDCYMCAGGLLHRDKDGVNVVSTEVDPDHANKVLAFARDMLRVASGMVLPTGTGEPVQLRVGMHSGPCMSGVVGWKMPRFCLFGDTINTASRMESTGRPGAIHISEPCWNCLGSIQTSDPRWRPTGGVEAKGKGRMETYMWTQADP